MNKVIVLEFQPVDSLRSMSTTRLLKIMSATRRTKIIYDSRLRDMFGASFSELSELSEFSDIDYKENRLYKEAAKINEYYCTVSKIFAESKKSFH